MGASQKRSENPKRQFDLGALYAILTEGNKLWRHDQRIRGLAPRSTFTKENLCPTFSQKGVGQRVLLASAASQLPY